MDKIIKDIKEALNTDNKTKAYDTQAKVIRSEGQTLWVHIPGGVDETPVKKTINAKAGDTVQVRVSGGSAWLVGNESAPPTDDTRAIVAETTAITANENATIAAQAAESAVESANVASAAAASAQTSASNALTAAQSAQTSADSALVSLSTVEDVVGVLNWITAHGTMTLTSDVAINPAHVYFVVDPVGDYVVGGTHYSIVAEPKVEDISTYYELSVDESVQNYVATHVVVDTEGLWLIPDSGGNKVLIATGAGSSFTTAGTYIIGKVSGVDTVFAKFTTDGVTMNATNSTQIAHLGYGEGNDDGGSLYNQPYYTLGKRKTTSTAYSASSTYNVGDLCVYNGKVYCCNTKITTAEAWNSSHWQLSIGNYSLVEGPGAVASGAWSHAEGVNTVAIGSDSHAEGEDTVASGSDSHAEGRQTTATNVASHAEGSGTESTGLYGSHSEGYFTDATGSYGSHSEGSYSTASGDASHSEGSYSTASANYSHAEGWRCEANGLQSHAQNQWTIANGDAQTTLGKNNIADTTSAVIIGNGTANNARSNALTVDWSGNVNIASGAKYKINGSNLSASDVSAVALSDKYTRSSAGDLAWTNQTDGDAKVIAKSALAFWNGAYNGNGSNLSKCSTGNIIGSNGGTMTGQLLTSYRSSVAMGSYGSAQTTVDGLAGEVRFSSGCSGSASIGTAYTKDGVTIPTGWYNFMYMPHRSGGKNGSADGDNANYGNLFLFGMNNANGRFIVRVSSSAVTEVVKIITTKEQQRGSIASTSVSANSYKDVSVTFSPSMASAPIVVCSLVSTSTAGAIGSISAAAINVSTTGFTVRIFNAGSSAREPAVNWIAMV